MCELVEVYESLKQAKICQSQYQFSREFLGRAPNYFAILKCHEIEPSTHVLMVLHLKLYELATHCKEPTDYDSYNAKQCLITLSNKVLSEIKTRCQVIG